MNEEVKNRVIRMAWEDRTTFDEIEKQTGFAEADVIKVMRSSLRPSGFRRWRKRVTGRLTKHARPFRNSRKRLKAPTTQDLINRAETES